jgi:RNA polymerase sigma-70 factor (ECF subfamily)
MQAETEPSEAARQAELVRRALDGDRAAMAEFSRLVGPIIHVRVARHLCLHAGGRAGRTDCEDLIQEVFLRLLAHRGRALRAWDPERGLDLVGFVGLIAQREVVNVLKSGRRRPWSNADELPPEDLIRDGRPTSEDETVRKDLVRHLLARLHDWLTPRGRELFQQVYLDEEPLEAVAERFGMKRSALYAWRNRVQNKAKAIFEELQRHEHPTPRRTAEAGRKG